MVLSVACCYALRRCILHGARAVCPKPLNVLHVATLRRCDAILPQIDVGSFVDYFLHTEVSKNQVSAYRMSAP
jgi:hypothetical protein